MGSLQKRLDVGLIISLVLFFLFQWLAVSSFVRSLTEEQAAYRLQQDSEGLLIALSFPQLRAAPILKPERIDPIYKRPFSGRYFQIEINGQVLRSRSLWDQELVLSPLDIGKTLKSHVTGPQGQQLLLLLSVYEKQEHIIAIAVTEDLSSIEAEIATFQIRYALLSMVILIILIFIQRRIVRGALAPLERGRRDMALLERGKIQTLSEAVPNEIKPFVKEINALIEGMQQRLQRSRNATGNLAHALKTPLTLLMQLADQKEIKQMPKLQQILSKQTTLIRHLIDRELKRARLAGSGRPRQSFQLEEEISPLFDALKKIYREKKLEMSYDIPKDLILPFDREDLLELLGNLLDNACKWARYRVTFHVELQEMILFRIEDDGPGVAETVLKQLSLRGQRLDESTDGHGLGLAIVRDIAEQYQGQIDFGKSERLGGFQVTVSFNLSATINH